MEELSDDKPARRVRRGALKWPLVGGGAIVLAVIGAFAADHLLRDRTLPPRFYVVESGHLYRSGQPTPEQLAGLISRYGIRTVLNLCQPTAANYVDDAPTAQQYGGRVVSLPISSKKPLSDEELATLRQTYGDPRNYPILVHCEHGVARTGVAVALWRIEEQGWDPAKAVEEMIACGYPVHDDSAHMRDLLLHWQRPAQSAPHDAR